MAIKTGFGIEHETHFVRPKGRGQFETDSGNMSSGTKYGIKRDHDPTVHSSLELVSTDPSKKPHVIVNDLIRREKEGNGVNAPFGNVLGTNKSNAGSYHLNMTMPFDSEKVKNTDELNKYHSKVRQGMRNLRWLEPLMMGMIGGSTERAIGNPDQPEGSVRQYSDSYANIGGTAVGKESKLYRQTSGQTKTLKGWFDFGYKSQSSGHSREVGKYGNSSANLKLDTNLKRSTYNSNRSIGDFTIKGYENNTTSNNNPKTVEFRFPDSFSSSGVMGLINFITFAMENGEHTEIENDAKNSKIWKEATQQIMEEGWNAQVDNKYFKKMAKEMKLDITLPAGKTLRTDIGFDLINDALHKKNKDGFFVKNYLKNNKKSELHNFNKDSWQYNYKVMMNKDNALTEKTKKFLKALSKIDTSRSNGWVNVQIKNKKIVIRDLITDIIGLEYSAEDYKDILYLLESEGIIRIKTLPNGEVDKIKIIKELKDAEIEKIIKKMKDNKTFFTDKFGLDDSLVEVRNPVVSRESRPETVRPHAPVGTAVRLEPTSLSEGIEVTYLQPVPEIVDDLSMMMEDILTESEFQNSNGEVLNWKIRIASKITISGLEISSIFNRGRNGKIILILKSSSLSINVSGENGEQGALGNWASKLRTLYDNSTSMIGNPTNLSNEEFISKINSAIIEMFNKGRLGNSKSKVIELSSAGIKTLQSKGIKLVSVPKQNGREYYLVTRENYSQARQKYGRNLRFINSIPYYKNYRVEIKNNQLLFYQGNIIKQRVKL